jgi:hypothetical protein
MWTVMHITKRTLFKWTTTKQKNNLNICDFWGSHGGEDGDCNVLWTWRQYVSPKRPYLPSSTYDVTTQKTDIYDMNIGKTCKLYMIRCAVRYWTTGLRI